MTARMLETITSATAHSTATVTRTVQDITNEGGKRGWGGGRKERERGERGEERGERRGGKREEGRGREDVVKISFRHLLPLNC